MRTTDEIELIKKRLDIVETTLSELVDIKQTILSIAKWVKGGVSSVVVALVTSGVVSGQLGAFLHALFGG